MMRIARQNAILKIIAEHEITTQAELSAALKKQGFDVTQATVSRDIKELRLIKVQDDKGIVKYNSSSRAEVEVVADRLTSILKHSLVMTDWAQNDVVVKTLPGVAQAAAAAIDAMHWGEVVGSVAGDDTILMVARDEKSAKTVVEKLRKFAQAERR